MSSLRCSTCGINYPHGHGFMRCRVCGGATAVITNDEPDPDWEYSVALKTPTVADAAVAAGIPAEDDPFWWRAEELYKAGFSYETALKVAELPVERR